MPISTFPTAAGGGIKLVQRGSAGSSGTVTITAVNTAKAFVNVFGTSSSGNVAASGTVASQSFGMGGDLQSNAFNNTGSQTGWSGTYPESTLSGGTTNLVTAVVQGYLQSATELVVSGACRWEVVEFA